MGLLGCWVVGSATPTATTATPPNQHKHQHHQHHQQHTNNTTNTNNTNKAKKTREHQKNGKKHRINQKLAQERSRSIPKWRQNRKKCASPPKIASDGAQGWPRPMMVQHLGSFLGPLWGPKIDQKSISGRKGGPRGAPKSVFYRFCWPSPFLSSFLVNFV